MISEMEERAVAGQARWHLMWESVLPARGSEPTLCPGSVPDSQLAVCEMPFPWALMTLFMCPGGVCICLLILVPGMELRSCAPELYHWPPGSVCNHEEPFSLLTFPTWVLFFRNT